MKAKFHFPSTFDHQQILRHLITNTKNYTEVQKLQWHIQMLCLQQRTLSPHFFKIWMLKYLERSMMFLPKPYNIVTSSFKGSQIDKKVPTSFENTKPSLLFKKKTYVNLLLKHYLSTGKKTLHQDLLAQNALLLKKKSHFFHVLPKLTTSNSQTLLPLFRNLLRSGLYQKLQQNLSAITQKEVRFFPRQHVSFVTKNQEDFSITGQQYQMNAEFILAELIKGLQRSKALPLRRLMFQMIKDARRCHEIKGLRISFSGPLGRKGRQARMIWKQYGEIPRNSLNRQVDFAQGAALTKLGLIGIKILLCF